VLQISDKPRRNVQAITFLLFCSMTWFSMSIQAAPHKTTQDKLILKKYCSQCHGAPNPDSHTPREWRSVMYRMQTHRQKRGFKKLNNKEFELVLRYLSERTNKKAVKK